MGSYLTNGFDWNFNTSYHYINNYTSRLFQNHKKTYKLINKTGRKNLGVDMKIFFFFLFKQFK